MRYLACCLTIMLLLAAAAVGRADDKPGSTAQPSGQEVSNAEVTYSENEIMAEVEGFFSGTSKDLANVIAKAFKDHGRPVGFIKGNEGSGAFFVGLRYGEGILYLKSKGKKQVYWQGPSLGFDWGGDAAKVFTLVYHMTGLEQIFQRFPGVDGSAYLVGGIGMNYQQSGDIILAPIRTGVGLRLGANIGYLHYTRGKHINPF